MMLPQLIRAPSARAAMLAQPQQALCLASGAMRPAVQWTGAAPGAFDAARAVMLLERRVLRVIVIFRLFLGIQGNKITRLND